MLLNINKTLLIETKEYIYDYDCNEAKIEQFLCFKGRFIDRQKIAMNIIEDIMKTHGKEKLLKYVVELARVELGIRELKPSARDHVVHALLSFILGIYINEKFLIDVTRVNDFQWKLTGLFHDIGYPTQIAKGILAQYTEKINEIRKEIKIPSKDITFKIVPEGLENLTNNLNSFDLIQERLNEWHLKIDVKEEYNRMINSGNICHGIVSSLTLLQIVDLLYDKYNPKRENLDESKMMDGINWSQECFDSDVISACSAIYIHNLPGRCFEEAKIKRSKAPVAFLLKLSDCLQEWERPSKENKTGFLANEFEITLNNDQLIFHTNIPEDIKEKIRDEIYSSLDIPDLYIP
jgi:hypothetical protein